MYTKDKFFPQRISEKKVFQMPKNAPEVEKNVFSHLSNELSVYGINEPKYIEQAIETALAVLINTHEDSQRHFQSMWLGGSEGIEKMWELSDTGWKLTLICAARHSSQLSVMLLKNLKHFK